MARPMLAKEFVLIYDSSAVGYATDFTLSVDKKTVDITTLASAGWTDSMVTDKSWNVDFNGLVTRSVADTSIGYTYLMTSLLTVDTSVYCAIRPNVSSNTFWDGTGYLTGVKMSGAVGEKVTFSGTFLGAGPLTSRTS